MNLISARLGQLVTWPIWLAVTFWLPSDLVCQFHQSSEVIGRDHLDTHNAGGFQRFHLCHTCLQLLR